MHNGDGDNGVKQHSEHNQNKAKLIFVGFLWLGPIDLMKCFQRTNVKENSGEQELTGTEVARKILKECGRALKKGGENGIEQCHEVKRVKQKGGETIPNNAGKQREQELEKGGEIPEKLTQRITQLSKLIPVVTGDPQEKSNVVRTHV